MRLGELPLVFLGVSISCQINTKLIRVSQLIEPLQLKGREWEDVTSPHGASQQAWGMRGGRKHMGTGEGWKTALETGRPLNTN